MNAQQTRDQAAAGSAARRARGHGSGRLASCETLALVAPFSPPVNVRFLEAVARRWAVRQRQADIAWWRAMGSGGGGRDGLSAVLRYIHLERRATRYGEFLLGQAPGAIPSMPVVISLPVWEVRQEEGKPAAVPTRAAARSRADSSRRYFCHSDNRGYRYTVDKEEMFHRITWHWAGRSGPCAFGLGELTGDPRIVETDAEGNDLGEGGAR